LFVRVMCCVKSVFSQQTEQLTHTYTQQTRKCHVMQQL
jgi:hypothetical protein